jgi:hypothetical protein
VAHAEWLPGAPVIGMARVRTVTPLTVVGAE